MVAGTTVVLVVVVVVVDVGGTVVEVVVVDVGGTVVDVVVVGGSVVVVGLAFFLPGPALGGRAGRNVHSAVAQSWGWEVTATSTPGRVPNVQTSTAGPDPRQESVGSVVVNWLRVPRYWAFPSEVRGALGFRTTREPFHTAEVT